MHIQTQYVVLMQLEAVGPVFQDQGKCTRNNFVSNIAKGKSNKLSFQLQRQISNASCHSKPLLPCRSLSPGLVVSKSNWAVSLKNKFLSWQLCQGSWTTELIPTPQHAFFVYLCSRIRVETNIMKYLNLWQAMYFITTSFSERFQEKLKQSAIDIGLRSSPS